MQLTGQIVSIDWGTSNFRAYVVDTASTSIVSTYESDKGVRSFVGERDPHLAQEEYLKQVISDLKVSTDAQVILSGMASSSIGIRELPYAQLPMSGDGSGLAVVQLPDWNSHEIYMISGVSDGMGFMRGEETQAIGALDHVGEVESLMLILPGTHSKHVLYSDGAYRSMGNFMTGELHALLSEHSILTTAVEKSSWKREYSEAFRQGVQRIHQSVHGLSGELLTLRAHELSGKMNRAEGAYYLSGLLIGAELSYLVDSDDVIYVSTGGVLYDLYREAIATLGLSGRTTFIREDSLAQIFVSGQIKIISAL